MNRFTKELNESITKADEAQAKADELNQTEKDETEQYFNNRIPRLLRDRMQQYMKRKEEANEKLQELNNKWRNTRKIVNKYRPLSWAPAPEEDEVQVEVEADSSQEADVSHRCGQKSPHWRSLRRDRRQTSVLRAFGFHEPNYTKHDPEPLPDAQPPPQDFVPRRLRRRQGGAQAPAPEKDAAQKQYKLKEDAAAAEAEARAQELVAVEARRRRQELAAKAEAKAKAEANPKAEVEVEVGKPEAHEAQKSDHASPPLPPPPPRRRRGIRRLAAAKARTAEAKPAEAVNSDSDSDSDSD